MTRSICIYNRHKKSYDRIAISHHHDDAVSRQKPNNDDAIRRVIGLVFVSVRAHTEEPIRSIAFVCIRSEQSAVDRPPASPRRRPRTRQLPQHWLPHVHEPICRLVSRPVPRTGRPVLRGVCMHVDAAS